MLPTLKGPGLFLAQSAGDAAPFDTLDGICGWARVTECAFDDFAGSVPDEARNRRMLSLG